MSGDEHVTAQERELIGRLGALPREADTSRDLWPEIESRVLNDPETRGRQRTFTQRSGVSGSGWLRAAAVIGIFAAGAASGFVAAKRAAPRSDSSMEATLALAAEVQRTGSEYVAALTAFTSVVDSMSSDIRGQGTDAGLAALFSAADQLAALQLGARDVETPEAREDTDPQRSVRF